MKKLFFYSCSEPFATQVISSGKLPKLISLVETYNDEAFKLIVLLCDHHQFRSEFGNAGGMKLFSDWLRRHHQMTEAAKSIEPDSKPQTAYRDNNLVKSSIEKTFGTANSEKCNLGEANLKSQTSSMKIVKERVSHNSICSGRNDNYKANSDAPKTETRPTQVREHNFETLSEIEMSYKQVEGGRDPKVDDEMLKLDGWSVDLLSVLCLCCKEAVNRVKIRDDEILVILENAFKNPDLAIIHERLLNAFQCFLYDDVGFQMLLSNNLVQALTKHLKRFLLSGHFRTVSHNKRKEKEITVGHLKAPSKAAVPKKVKKTESEKVAEISQVAKSSSKNNREMVLSQKVNQTDDTDNSNKAIKEAEGDFNIPSEAKPRPVYSINSPSYIPQTEWNQFNFDGGKCIETFSPNDNIGQSYSKSYSPFSNLFYYSPSESGSDCSPNTSPFSSPEYQQNYKPGGKASRHLYYMCGSDSESDGAIAGSSIMGSPILSVEDLIDLPEGLEYSPVVSPAPGSVELDKELDRDVGETKESNTIVSDVKEITAPRKKLFGLDESIIEIKTFEPFRGEKHSDDTSTDKSIHLTKEWETTCPLFIKDTLGKLSEHNSLNKANNVETMEDKTDEHMNETDLLSKDDIEFKESVEAKALLTYLAEEDETQLEKKTCHSTYTENTIFILLSRVSHVTDPSLYLVNTDTIVTLLDYLSMVDRPLARCSRLLSRIFRNLLCFQTVLNLGIPMLIYCKLLKHADMPRLVDNLKRKEKKKRPRTLSECSEVDIDSDRFSMSDNSSDTVDHQSKRHKADNGVEARKRTVIGKCILNNNIPCL